MHLRMKCLEIGIIISSSYSMEEFFWLSSNFPTSYNLLIMSSLIQVLLISGLLQKHKIRSLTDHISFWVLLLQAREIPPLGSSATESELTLNRPIFWISSCSPSWSSSNSMMSSTQLLLKKCFLKLTSSFPMQEASTLLLFSLILPSRAYAMSREPNWHPINFICLWFSQTYLMNSESFSIQLSFQGISPSPMISRACLFRLPQSILSERPAEL